MPSGRTHDLITAFTTPILIVVLYYFGFSNNTNLIITSSYLFSSLMFNGDLDVPSRPYYRWWILRFIWKPYQYFIQHRSILSHGIIIGTMVRLLYLLTIPVIIMYFVGFDFSIFYNIETLYILLGLELGSTVHTLSDNIL